MVRDSISGNPIANKNISLRIILHQGSQGGTIVYDETDSATTNQFGLFNVNVGTGKVNSGTFATIPWSQYYYYQEVQIDTTGGSNYTSIGTSQLLSVPYALSADSALHVSLKAGAGISINNDTISGNYKAGNAIQIIGDSVIAGNYKAGTGIQISNDTINYTGIVNLSSGYGINLSGDAANTTISSSVGFSFIQVFNTPGTYTITFPVSHNIMVEAWGAGGGAALMLDSPYYSGNGGAGGYAKSIFKVYAGVSYTIVVGTPGSSVDNLFSDGFLSGEDGSFSSVSDSAGVLISADAGLGGGECENPCNGAGGEGRGTVNLNGQPGSSFAGGNAPLSGGPNSNDGDGGQPGGGATGGYPYISQGGNGLVVIYY